MPAHSFRSIVALLGLTVALALSARGAPTPTRAPIPTPTMTGTPMPDPTPLPWSTPAPPTSSVQFPTPVPAVRYVCADRDGVILRTDLGCEYKGDLGLSDDTPVELIGTRNRCAAVRTADGTTGYVPAKYLCNAPSPVPTTAPTATQPPPSPATRPPAEPLPTRTPVPPSPPPPCLSWAEARGYAGQSQCVCGPVVQTNYATRTKGQPTFLDIGARYPSTSRFQVVIWGQYRDNFPQGPESMYLGASMRVCGTIALYQGIGQIEVRTPSSITRQ